MLLLKIMTYAGPTLDDSPFEGHQIIANIQEVIFRQADPEVPGSHGVAEVWKDGKEESSTHPVFSCAYVMNENGRTVSRFYKSDVNSWGGSDFG